MPDVKHITVNGVTYDIPTGGSPVRIKRLSSGNFALYSDTTTTNFNNLAAGTIIYLTEPTSGIRLMEGTTILNNLKLISCVYDYTTNTSTGTTMPYISINKPFFAMVESTTGSVVTARVISSFRSRLANNYLLDKAYTETNLTNYIYRTGSIVKEETFSSGYEPFIIKDTSSNTVTPSEMTCYTMDDLSYIICYKFTSMTADLTVEVYSNGSITSNLYRNYTYPYLSDRVVANSVGNDMIDSRRSRLYVNTSTSDNKLSVKTINLPRTSAKAAILFYGKLIDGAWQ